MSSSTWIAIYMPMFILFFIIIPQQREMEKTAAVLKIKRRKDAIIMTNEVLKKYIGKNCRISTGSFGTNVTGIILDVNNNWLEVETKKGKELINADFIQSIKVK